MKYSIYLAIITLFLSSCGRNNSPVMISSEKGTAESVYLTHDHNDQPVVVWTEKDNNGLTLYFAISTDEGKSFSEKTNIPLAPDVATHPESMPKVAFRKDGTIIAAYEKKAPTKANKYASAIYYTMSDDGGNSWTGEASLHSDTATGKSRSYFDIERLPDGEIGASWLDIKLANDTGGRSVKFAKTSPSNKFSGEVVIDSSACQCCRIDVYTDQSESIFIAYRGLMKGDFGKQIRDMMIATSTDHGKTFSTPIRISADNWNIDGCPHTGPSLCSNKGGLISLWYTEGSGTGIYYARKGKGDSGFSPRQQVSDSGHHPQLSANGDRIAMLWEENTENNAQSKTVIYYRIVKDGIDLVTNALTPEDANAFLPVITPTTDGFLTAYLMEQNNHVAVYVKKI